jgi:hypothetical protein
MPTQIHEIMKAFASDIKDQMFAPDSSGRAFVPPSWQKDRVLETGSSSQSCHTTSLDKRLTGGYEHSSIFSLRRENT